jgi:hypothetical protein
MELLGAEKELTRNSDELARRRMGQQGTRPMDASVRL